MFYLTPLWSRIRDTALNFFVLSLPSVFVRLFLFFWPVCSFIYNFFLSIWFYLYFSMYVCMPVIVSISVYLFIYPAYLTVCPLNYLFIYYVSAYQRIDLLSIFFYFQVSLIDLGAGGSWAKRVFKFFPLTKTNKPINWFLQHFTVNNNF